MTALISACSDTKRDPYQAPRDAEEFERLDGGRIRAFAASRLSGYRAHDAEDAAAEIWEKLVTNQVWLQYRTDHASKHTGDPVTWKYFVNSKVVLYTRGKSEAIGTRHWREPLKCDEPAGESGATWAEAFGGGTVDEYPSLGDDSYESLRDWLALHPPEPAPCSMLELLDALAEAAGAGERLTRNVIVRELGLAPGEASNAMVTLRAALREAQEAPREIHRFTLGGVDLTAADIRTAADRLRRSKGNRVAPAWAGHPLEAADPGWYVRFAKAELRARPELKIRRGTHATGHNSQVKVALIAGLDRLLTELGAPEPEPEVTNLETFEAELHKLRIPGLPVRHILAAAAKVWPQ
jgi:hypothetical protein